MTDEHMPREPSWRRLYRNPRRGWIAGVCAGLADYFGVGTCLVRVLVLVLVSVRRYTDAVVRSRRSEPLSPAAELQWASSLH